MKKVLNKLMKACDPVKVYTLLAVVFMLMDLYESEYIALIIQVVASLLYGVMVVQLCKDNNMKAASVAVFIYLLGNVILMLTAKPKQNTVTVPVTITVTVPKTDATPAVVPVVEGFTKKPKPRWWEKGPLKPKFQLIDKFNKNLSEELTKLDSDVKPKIEQIKNLRGKDYTNRYNMVKNRLSALQLFQSRAAIDMELIAFKNDIDVEFGMAMQTQAENTGMMTNRPVVRPPPPNNGHQTTATSEPFTSVSNSNNMANYYEGRAQWTEQIKPDGAPVVVENQSESPVFGRPCSALETPITKFLNYGINTQTYSPLFQLDHENPLKVQTAYDSASKPYEMASMV